MGIFKKKDNMDGGSAKVLSKTKLNKETRIDRKITDEITKTTDSMKIMSSTLDINDNEKMEEASKTLLRSFDIATKKITSTFEEIVETKKIVNNDFLTVQIMIAEYEKGANIDNIMKVIQFFTNEVEAQLSHGRSVMITNKILIEPTDYVGKMIPVAKITSSETGVNQISWQKISEVLKNSNIINSSEQVTIENLVRAIELNITNGYYMKLGNLVISKIDHDRSELMVLFSSNTIMKMNKIYSRDRLAKRAKVVDNTNYIENYKNAVGDHPEKEKKLHKSLKKIETNAKNISEDKIEKIIENEKDFSDNIKSIEKRKNKIDELSKIKESEKDIEDIILEKTKLNIEEDAFSKKEMRQKAKDLKQKAKEEKKLASASKVEEEYNENDNKESEIIEDENLNPTNEVSDSTNKETYNFMDDNDEQLSEEKNNEINE